MKFHCIVKLGWMSLKNTDELDKLLMLKLKMETTDWRAGQRNPTAYNTLADGYIRCERPRKAIALINALLPGYGNDDDDVFSLLKNVEVSVSFYLPATVYETHTLLIKIETPRTFIRWTSMRRRSTCY